MKKVCVIGLGYIGLPTSILLAESGFDVVGFDVDEKKVIAINNNDSVIQEPEILPRLKNAIENCSFRASSKIEEADVFIIAVPTPITQDKKADLSFVWQACKSIGKVLKKNNIVILESTCSVNSPNKLADLILEQTSLKAGKDFFIGYCPERVLPGNIFYELVYNNRVIGGIDNESSKVIAGFYSTFVKGELFLTDSKTSEMVKLVENSYRDVQIAFAHQVASMANSVGINPYELIDIANKHPRVNILTPRCGVGGHCIAIDPWFLIEDFAGVTQLLKVARQINDQRPHEVFGVINTEIQSFKKEFNKQPKIAVLGLTYKPDVDDLRESPAIEIASLIHNSLNNAFDYLFLSDPNITMKHIEGNLKNLLVPVEQALDHCNIVVLLVAHKEFKEINFDLVSANKIIDFSGLNLKVFNTQKLIDLKGQIKTRELL